MEVLLLKSSLCLLAFILFYKILLEKTSIHKFKRYYLLGVILISIVIPFITFTDYIELQEITTNATRITAFSEIQAFEETTNYIPIVLWSIYGLGVFLFSIRFLYHLNEIALKIRRNPKQKTQNFICVLLNDLMIPHTFFHYIFVNKTKFENNTIPKEVLLHEQTHAKQKHSIDILCIEIVQVLFWFHPLVYILKKDIKLNHEFLADQAVINQGIESIKYQKTLLSYSSNQQDLTFEHAINYSSIKKRFTVMKTNTSKQTFWLRSLLLLPLLAFLIFSFSTKKTIKIDTHTTHVIAKDSKKKLIITIQINDIMINGIGSSIQTFTRDLNAITKDWEETDYISIKPNVMIASTSQEYLDEVEMEFTKTQYAKSNRGMKLIPPVPTASKVVKEAQTKTPILEVHKNPFQLVLNGQETSFDHLKEDFKTATNNQKTDLRINTSGAIDYEIIKEIMSKTKDNLKKIRLSEGAYIENNSNQKTLATINGIACNGTCEVNLSIEGVEGLILGTTTKQEIKSFLFKIEGKNTVKVIGNTLNNEAKKQLNNLENGNIIQLFNLKTATEKLAPILITIVSKNDKKYSNSPIVKIAEESELPLPPAPPAPPASKEKKGEISNIPPPPPPIPGDATEKQKAEYEKVLKAYYKKYKIKNGHVSTNMIPPPPPPKSPLDHAIDMAKKDAIFYYEGNKISSDEAIKLLKEDNDLNISTQSKNVNRPQVRITTNPVITDEKGNVITKTETLDVVKANVTKDRNGYVVLNGTTYLYTVKNNKITYFNRWGKQVNEKGELLKK